MRRIKLVVAYDGTNYHGWQKQNNEETIEGVINNVLSDLLKEDISIIGASRTDAGVHAYGNVAVFDTNSRIPADKIAYAMNVRLPGDIRVQESCEVDGDFHPRFCNCTKTYEYKILNRNMPLPDKRLYSHFVYYNLDVDRMKKAAKYIVGEHDFKCFCSANSQVLETIRTIYLIDIFKGSDDIITVRIMGNGFLYNMVRIIAGTLIEVGRGAMEPEHLKTIIESKDRKNAGPTAPANGLTLVNIKY